MGVIRVLFNQFFLSVIALNTLSIIGFDFYFFLFILDFFCGISMNDNKCSSISGGLFILCKKHSEMIYGFFFHWTKKCFLNNFPAITYHPCCMCTECFLIKQHSSPHYHIPKIPSYRLTMIMHEALFDGLIYYRLSLFTSTFLHHLHSFFSYSIVTEGVL